MSSPKDKSNVIKYRPQLDGLRFIAVFFVLIYHYLPGFQYVGRIVNLNIMLTFFFVLSSFLITKILLISKEKGTEAGYGKHKIALVFLIRRTLRIFPAYYFYLVLLLILPYVGQLVRAHALIFFLYLSNFHIYFTQQFGDLTAHIWTLAVEEQFYLVWPWLILYTPNKHLPKMFLVLFALGPISRAIFYALMDNPTLEMPTIQVLTPACLDGFGLGGLLAYQHLNGKTSNPVYKKIFLALIPVYIYTLFSGYASFSIVFDRAFISILAAIFIEGASNGYKNFFGRFLENKTVLYLAKISYGIYLYHIFAAYLFWRVMGKISPVLKTKFGIDLFPLSEFFAIPIVSFFIYLLLSIALAALSWHFLERPISNLKQLFMYKTPQKKTAPEVEKEVINPIEQVPDPNLSNTSVPVK